MAREPAGADRPQAPGSFARGSFLESSRAADILRAETTGGLLLIVAARSPWSGRTPLVDAYYDAANLKVGPDALHLDLSLGTWAADGLLAIFFFVAGLELKREFVAGDLRDPRRAALPVAAAVGGMVAPALVFVAVNPGTGDLGGWAIPTATDIAFAVAVLAVISTHLPSGLRTFLLTLAVVDDLLAITVIAVFYTDDLRLSYLLLALVPIGLFGVLVQRRISHPLLLLPLALVAWALVHESGVHATVAGVLLGFTVPVLSRHGRRAAGSPSTSSTWSGRSRPASRSPSSRSSPQASTSAAGRARRRAHRSGRARYHRRSGARQADRHHRSHLAAPHVHPGRPRRRARLDRRGRDGHARRHRVHGLAADRRARLRPGCTGERARQGRRARRLAARRLLAALVLRPRNRVYRRLCELEEATPTKTDPDVFRARSGTGDPLRQQRRRAGSPR